MGITKTRLTSVLLNQQNTVMMDLFPMQLVDSVERSDASDAMLPTGMSSVWRALLRRGDVSIVEFISHLARQSRTSVRSRVIRHGRTPGEIRHFELSWNVYQFDAK